MLLGVDGTGTLALMIPEARVLDLRFPIVANHVKSFATKVGSTCVLSLLLPLFFWAFPHKEGDNFLHEIVWDRFI